MTLKDRMARAEKMLVKINGALDKQNEINENAFTMLRLLEGHAEELKAKLIAEGVW